MNWSTVLIARNEESTLPRLLASLSEFKERGGEVILCDTGSTDKTVEVAKSLGCKVTEVGDRFRRTISEDEAKAINERFVVDGEKPVVMAGESLFDYAQARNFSSSLATTDWVWAIDCDEVAETLNLDALEGILNDPDIHRIEYGFTFAHDAAGKPTVQFMHSKMFRRSKMRWTSVVHEVLEDTDGPTRAQFVPADIIDLHHYQNTATNRGGYLKGLALDCFENPEKDRQSHYFSREMLWTGRPKSAIKEFLRHVAMNKWQPERSQSAIYIGEAYAQLGDEEKAVEWWNKAYAIEAGRREPLIRLARHYWSKNDPRRCAAYATAALTIPQDNFYANDLNHYRQEPHELLYWSLFLTGDREGSRQHFDKALEYQPTNSKYLHDYRVDHALPTVDIIIPHLGREEGLARAKKSIENLNYPANFITVTVDDRVEPTVPEKVRDMVAKTSGEFICFMANDAEMHPDSLILAVIEWVKTGKRLIAMNSGTPECEHFIIMRSVINDLENKEVFSTDMTHVGVDNWLWAQCDAMKEAIRCEEAKVEHFHFSQGKGPWDAVYEKGWANAEKDRETLKLKLAHLQLAN